MTAFMFLFTLSSVSSALISARENMRPWKKGKTNETLMELKVNGFSPKDF